MKMTAGVSLGALIFFFFSVSPAENSRKNRYEDRIRSALDFVDHYQTSGNDGYYPGQWRAQVTSYFPTKLGAGKYQVPFEDPTAFVVSSVANVLAEVYQYDSSYREIPPMLKRASEGLAIYRYGELFNFYPWTKHKGVKIRKPKYFPMSAKLLGSMNIPADADTTSVTYTFLHHLDSMEKRMDSADNNLMLPKKVVSAFSSIRDINRKPHPANSTQGLFNTHAFLTWLYDEKNPAMPKNMFEPPERGPRIPWAINDVDCIVNTNVLKMLTYAKKTSNPGYRASCSYLNKVVQRDQYFSCGLYYPNSFILPYSMAASMDAGVSCLRPSTNLLLSHLLYHQHKNGSWRNSYLGRADHIQSTIWAVNALLILGNPKNSYHREKVKNGLNYLMANARRDSSGRLYWPGQIFFTGWLGSRQPIVWRSTAYTTALGVKAMVLADKKWKL